MVGQAALRPGVRVIVIGAGVAGLAAARAIHRTGAKVTVLEARDRIGGRIHTDRSTFGVPVELGAQYVQGTRRSDGTPSPVWKMVQDNGWKSVPYSTDNAEAVRDGEDVSMEQLGGLYEGFEAFVGRARGGATGSFEAAVVAYAKSARLGNRQAAELRAVVASVVGLEFAGDLDQVSIAGAGMAGSYAGGNHLLTGGYDQVPAFLAAGLPDLRMGEVVETVDHGGAHCTVTTGKGAYEADHIVCTLPLGVLQAKAVRFSPALPSGKTEAIERMGMGHLGKVILEFPRRFWPGGVNGFLSL